MSSLMQHHGGRSPDGLRVELVANLVEKDADCDTYHGPAAYQPNPEATSFTHAVETIPGTTLPRLWKFYRRPAGMFGCWVVFRYNGKEHVPDLSVPLQLFKMPRDAERMSDEDAIKHWRSE